MLRANLIPDEEKKAIHTEEIRRLILFFGLGLIGILVVTTSLLFPSFIILSFQKQELERSLTSQKQVIERGEESGTTSRVERLKNIIASLRLLPTSSAQTSSILNILLSKQQGIEVTSMAVRKNTELSLAGSADTRDDLLFFEKFLNDSGMFQSISSPRSNLISEKSISFTYQGTLKPQFALKTAK